jgi:hypothetical protein
MGRQRRCIAPLPAAWLYIEKSVSAKRTQLKNAHMLRHETVIKKTELGSFCKKRQKMGKKAPKYRSGRVV